MYERDLVALSLRDGDPETVREWGASVTQRQRALEREPESLLFLDKENGRFNISLVKNVIFFCVEENKYKSKAKDNSSM